ncbi:hypothetical protein F2Q69_00003699 [Brassica cretica]|uniref:Uncharacterized protein n=1 Tax=Brassica cretica TaxID=69181 RepID=A0A8S9PIF7_BRACR|nr:hypothetical protein F2Q69_00003699 [Brassica cretica]
MKNSSFSHEREKTTLEEAPMQMSCNRFHTANLSSWDRRRRVLLWRFTIRREEEDLEEKKGDDAVELLL